MKATFVTREFGKTGAELTKEEFIQMMKEDIESAKEAYRAWSDKTAEEKYIADSKIYAERRQQVIDRIIENSYAKYKREYYRLRWVEKMVSSYPEVMERLGYSHYGHDLTSLRWNTEPWSNSSRYITIKHLDRELEYLYDCAIKNRYFQQATGWSIVEDFNTEFKLHLSDELQEEWKADEHNLAESIAKFYEGCTYWGD
jgi:hypothetical protein